MAASRFDGECGVVIPAVIETLSMTFEAEGAPEAAMYYAEKDRSVSS